MEVADARIRARENVGRSQKNEGQIVGDQLLHAIIELFALRIIEGDHLLLHQLIEFALQPVAGCVSPMCHKCDVPLNVHTFISGLGSASPPPSPMIAAS